MLARTLPGKITCKDLVLIGLKQHPIHQSLFRLTADMSPECTLDIVSALNIERKVISSLNCIEIGNLLKE